MSRLRLPARARLRIAASSAVGALLLVPALAVAAPPNGNGNGGASANGKGDAAAAQALFYEARTLMHDGKFSTACPKLEESLRLDYGMGTEFNLADCNEKLGRLASAWSGFVNVAAMAKTQNQPQREKVARERAAALEPRLPNMTIDVAEPVANLEVKRDGVVVGAPSWGTAVPVDPGNHHITASAPGRKPWEQDVSAVEGRPLKVAVPALPALATTAPVVAAAPPPAPAGEEAGPAPAPLAFPEPVVEKSNTQRTIGWVAAAAGVAGLGVGVGFGIDSLVMRDHARQHCNGDLCDATGLDQRDRAILSGDIATIASIAGGALLVGGFVLVLTSPKGGSREKGNPTTATSIVAAPRVANNGGGLSIGGTFQ